MEVKMGRKITKLRGEHYLDVFVSYQLKARIKKLAEKYDRTVADMVRTLIKVGIPVMEGLTEAEEKILKDSITLARKMKKVTQMKIEEGGFDGNELKTEL
jgi:predicted DNA-binding protein